MMMPQSPRDQQDDDQEIVVSVAVLTSRFNALDRGMGEMSTAVRELDRGVSALTNRLDRETDRLRSIEVEHRAQLVAMDLRITALASDVTNKFSGLAGQVGGKVSTVWVEKSVVFVKDLVPWIVAALAIAGKVHLSS